MNPSTGTDTHGDALELDPDNFNEHSSLLPSKTASKIAPSINHYSSNDGLTNSCSGADLNLDNSRNDDQEQWSPSAGTTMHIPSIHGHRTWPQFWVFFRTRLRYYVPVVGWLPKYDVMLNLQGDIMAGITVAFLIIPQSLSYAQALVQVPPVFGLYSAMIPLIVYSLLGTSRQLAVGPEALVSILVGSSVREFTTWRDSPNPETNSSASILPGMFSFISEPSVGTHDPMENVQATTLLCLMVGVFTFLLGFFRLGFLDSVLSRALLRGFVLAVAMVVMIDMSETLFGIIPPVGQCIANVTESVLASAHGSTSKFILEDLPAPVEETASPIEKLIHTLINLSHAHILTTILSVTSILFLLLSRQLKRHYKHVKWLQLVPEILVLVLTSIILSQVFRWDCQGVAILNRVLAPETPADGTEYITHPIPTLEKVKYLTLPAILISVIGFVESIVVAKTYASKHRYTVSPNRELVAIGVGNIVSSFFGGFPGFGSLGRSAVNDSAGARTQVAGFTTGVIVYCTSVWLLPYFEFLPKAVCSSIIVVAALKLVEVEDIEFIFRLHAWGDLGLLLLTFCSTIFVSIEVGTLISVGVSLLLVVKHTTQTRLAILGKTLVVDPSTGIVKTKFRSMHEQSGKIERIEGGIVVRIEEGMFFGNVGQLKDRLKRIEAYGDLSVHPSEEPRRGGGNAMVSAVMTPPTYAQAHDNDSPSLQPVSFIDDSDTIKSVVFDMTAVSDIDATATQIMTEIVHEYHSRGIIVCFVKLRETCKESFERSGIYSVVGEQHFFGKIRDAIAYLGAESRIKDTGINGAFVVDGMPSSGLLGIGGSKQARKLNNHNIDDEASELPGATPQHNYSANSAGSATLQTASAIALRDSRLDTLIESQNGYASTELSGASTLTQAMSSKTGIHSRRRGGGRTRDIHRHAGLLTADHREEDVMQLFSDSENGLSGSEDDDDIDNLSTPTSTRNASKFRTNPGSH
ncbi:hypothetical protein BDV3_003553 [Batrachochytrium dendrobatidis]|nr:hypothetical protein BDEG_21919 [Batrachochytrium dendrobatidis JEL423]